MQRIETSPRVASSRSGACAAPTVRSYRATLRPAYGLRTAVRVAGFAAFGMMVTGAEAQRQAVAVAPHRLAPAGQINGYSIRTIRPTIIPAGASGVTLTVSGALPDFTLGNFQVCFFAGAATAPLTPTPSTLGTVIVAIPASTIQGIPASSFTVANGFMLGGLLSVVPQGATCDGSVNPTVSNSFSVPVVETVLGPYTGPTSIPQINPKTSLQSGPTILVFPGSGFSTATVVGLGTFGNVTPKVLSPTALSVAVPTAFSASPTGTTALLTACNTGVSNAYCGAGAPILLTVGALAPSAGTLTVTPAGVTTLGPTTLTAQFKKDGLGTLPPGEPGVPSGFVTFAGAGAPSSPVPLALDSTAIFVSQSTSTQALTAATPVISPVAASYQTPQLVTITDTTPGTTIYYTLNGFYPTLTSAVYTGPFYLSTTTSISAIAVASAYYDSRAANSQITLSIPTQLGFLSQPTTTSVGAQITPDVTVAIQDSTGTTVTTATNVVTLAISGKYTGKLVGALTASAVNGVATFPGLSVDAAGLGYLLSASSAGLTGGTSTAFDVTGPAVIVGLAGPLVGVGSTLPGTVTLASAAPVGGTVVTLVSTGPSVVSVSPASVTIAAGQTSGSFTYTGVAAGSVAISASALNFATGTASVAATTAQVSLGTIPAVAPGQMASLALSLTTVAPPGGLTVSFTSSNTGVATVTQSVVIPAGQQTAATNPQITGVLIGTTTVTASAPGYAPDSRSVNVTVVAAFNPASTNLNLSTSTNTKLTISAPAPAGGIAFKLSSDDPTKATIGSSVTIAQGTTSVAVSITGVADGNTSIRANSPGVLEAVGTVTVQSVAAPSVIFNSSSLLTGVNLETGIYPYLPQAPPKPTTVTVTVAPAEVPLVRISLSPTVVGTSSITFTNVTTAGYLPVIYVQGQRQATTTMTVSSPGYTDGSTTVTVWPSGFSFNRGNNDFSTTTFANSTPIFVYGAILSPQTLGVMRVGVAVSPGLGTLSVPVTSSNPNVGSITTSPVIFNAGDSAGMTFFKPTSGGTATVSVGAAPAGFSSPSDFQTAVATVTTPLAIISTTSVVTGKGVQAPVNAYPAVAPSNPVTPTVTSDGPAIATLSISNTGQITATVQ